MAVPNKGIFIIGAKRTPFCKYGGTLRELPASYAFAAAAKDAIRTAKLNPNFIDNTVVGNVYFLSQCDGGKTPRYCGTYSGVPINKPALGVNKACGTGLQALIASAVDILTDSANISLSGGTENMSSLPFLVRNARFGTTLGGVYNLEDHIKRVSLDSYTGLTMQESAEYIAKKYGIGRQEVDEYTLQNHLKWKTASNSNVFDDELTSLTVTIKKKEIIVDKDAVTNPDIRIEDLHSEATLVENGFVITIGNSAPPADGAAALLVANEQAVNHHQLQPLSRVVAWATVGVDPADAGLGAVIAVRSLLNAVKMGVDDVDLFEINDTFSSQTLATVLALKLDKSKVNINGGAVAMGNPVAATGARMVTHLVHQLRRRNLKRAIAASNCGGGQGVAIMLENINTHL